MAPSESVGELATEEEALDASERMDSSLILVWSGSSSTLTGRIVPCSAALMTSCLGSVMIAPVDFEHGDSSMGVTVMREEDGESNDCARILTLGDGVLGGAIIVAMMERRSSSGDVMLRNINQERRWEFKASRLS